MSQEKSGESGLGFDDVLDQVNPFGPYQWRTWFIGAVFEVPMAFCIMFFVFGGANPGWKCAQVAGNETGLINTSSSQSYTNTSLLIDGQCQLNSSVCPNRIYNEDSSSIVSEWDLVCERQYISTTITTCLMAGIGVGAAVFGHLADTYGRRHVFIIVNVLALVGQITQAFSTSWQLFAVIRFFIGFFVGGVLMLAYVIPMEVVGRQYRTLCTMVDGWSIGCLVFIGIAFLIPDWRHLSLVTGFISLPLALTWFCFRESPRWLIQHKRIEEASHILNYIAKVNKRPAPDLSILDIIYKQDTEAKLRERHYSFLDLFRSRELTVNTLVMMYLWCLCSVAYFGVAINMRDVSGNLFVDFAILSVADLVFKLSIIGTTKWYVGVHGFGRRRSLVGYLSVVCACFVGIIIFDSTGTFDAQPRLRIAVALVGRGAVQACWGVATIYSAELFPTVVRNIACAACSIGARIGGVVAPFVAYLHFFHHSIPYVVFSVMSVSCALFVLFLPETRDKPLPDALPHDRDFCCSHACRRRNHPYTITAGHEIKSDVTAC